MSCKRLDIYYTIVSPVPLPVTVGYEAQLYSAAESQGQVELAVVITDPPSGAPMPFTLLLNTHDHNAGRYLCTHPCTIHRRKLEYCNNPLTLSVFLVCHCVHKSLILFTYVHTTSVQFHLL